MKFSLILLLLICYSFECFSKSFAFGSCLHQKKSQEILNSIYEKKPDKIIFLGDNVYGDTNDGIQNLKEAYGVLRENLNHFKYGYLKKHVIGSWPHLLLKLLGSFWEASRNFWKKH